MGKTPLSSSSAPPTQGSVVFAIVIMTMFGGGFLFLGAMGAREIWREWPLARASVNWPQATGTVIEASVTGRRRRRRARFEYSYTVEGQVFTSRQGGYLTGFFSNQAKDLARELSPGDRVHVYYDPRRPSEAVLITGYSRARFALAIVVMLVFMGLGLLVLGQGVPAMWRQRQR